MTVQDQLYRLPAPLAFLALANIDKDVLEENPPAHSVEFALLMAFVWGKTEEGHKFWRRTADWARKNLDQGSDLSGTSWEDFDDSSED